MKTISLSIVLLLAIGGVVSAQPLAKAPEASKASVSVTKAELQQERKEIQHELKQIQDIHKKLKDQTRQSLSRPLLDQSKKVKQIFKINGKPKRLKTVTLVSTSRITHI